MHDLREIKPEQLIVITELTNILPHDIIKLQKDKIFIDPISNDLHFDFSSINDGEVMNIHGIIKANNLDLVFVLNIDTGNDISMPIVNQLQYSAYINYIVTGNICIDIDEVNNSICKN